MAQPVLSCVQSYSSVNHRNAEQTRGDSESALRRQARGGAEAATGPHLQEQLAQACQAAPYRGSMIKIHISLRRAKELIV